MSTPPDLQGGGCGMANHLLFKVLSTINWLYLSISLTFFMSEETALSDLHRASIHDVTAD